MFRYGDPLAIQIARPRDLCLGDRTLPSIVLSDRHNLRQLIRSADLDYTE
jgi:hypothetical protein